MNEIEEILNRIKTHKSVEGYIITNINGDIIKTNFITDKLEYRDRVISFIPEFVMQCRNAIINLNREVG